MRDGLKLFHGLRDCSFSSYALMHLRSYALFFEGRRDFLVTIPLTERIAMTDVKEIATPAKMRACNDKKEGFFSGLQNAGPQIARRQGNLVTCIMLSAYLW